MAKVLVGVATRVNSASSTVFPSSPPTPLSFPLDSLAQQGLVLCTSETCRMVRVCVCVCVCVYAYMQYWLWKTVHALLLWLGMTVCDIPPENLRGTGMSTQRWGSPHSPRHGDHHRGRHYDSSSTLPRLQTQTHTHTHGHTCRNTFHLLLCTIDFCSDCALTICIRITLLIQQLLCVVKVHGVMHVHV